ncbi:TPA: prolipoprotein diacylglyceryl transferase [Candidatus Woesearchaeota archaeon]|nr:prolipoprotein diacylglyceryl transferase [Candidatus Woesearchaeota archaeon]
MFHHNINPVLLDLGAVKIYYYGLAYIIGFALAYWFLWRAVKQGRLKGMTPERLDSLMMAIILGVVIGSRIGYFLFNDPLLLLREPLSFFRFWQGGMAFHGGLIGVFIAGWLFCRRNRVSLFRIGDILVIPTALALAIGRIANFINAEIVGTVTRVSWCVVFPGVEGCRHPYQLYAAASHFLLFFILLLLSMVKWVKKHKGGLFWGFVIGYGILRFITDFFRDEPMLGFLKISQWGSVVMVVVGGAALWLMSKKRGKGRERVLS